MDRFPICVIDPQVKVSSAQGLVDRRDLIRRIFCRTGGESVPQAAFLCGFSGQPGVQRQQDRVILVGPAPEGFALFRRFFQAV